MPHQERALLPLLKASVRVLFYHKWASKNRKEFPAIRMLSVHFWEKFGQYFRSDTLPRPFSAIGVHIHRGIKVELDAGAVGIFLCVNSRAVRDD